MFDNLIHDLKLIYAAWQSPSPASISVALESAGDLLTQGYSIFKDLFGQKMALSKPCEVVVKEFIDECEKSPKGAMKADAIDGSRLLAILQLIQKLLALFTNKELPETA